MTSDLLEPDSSNNYVCQNQQLFHRLPFLEKPPANWQGHHYKLDSLRFPSTTCVLADMFGDSKLFPQSLPNQKHRDKNSLSIGFAQQ